MPNYLEQSQERCSEIRKQRCVFSIFQVEGSIECGVVYHSQDEAEHWQDSGHDLIKPINDLLVVNGVEQLENSEHWPKLQIPRSEELEEINEEREGASQEIKDEGG